MLNQTWRKVFVYIPILGSVISILMLFIRYAGDRSFSIKRIYASMLLCAANFFVGFVLFAYLLRGLNALLSLGIPPTVAIVLDFLLSGWLMNVVFLLYYRKTFEKSGSEG